MPVATTRLAGIVSLKLTPFNAAMLVLGFVIVNVSELVSPTAIDAGLKLLVMVGDFSDTKFAVTVCAWLIVTVVEARFACATFPVHCVNA